MLKNIIEIIDQSMKQQDVLVKNQTRFCKIKITYVGTKLKWQIVEYVELHKMVKKIHLKIFKIKKINRLQTESIVKKKFRKGEMSLWK